MVQGALGEVCGSGECVLGVAELAEREGEAGCGELAVEVVVGVMGVVRVVVVVVGPARDPHPSEHGGGVGPGVAVCAHAAGVQAVRDHVVGPEGVDVRWQNQRAHQELIPGQLYRRVATATRDGGTDG